MRWISLPLASSLALAATAGPAADAPLRPEKMRQAMGLKLGAWKTKARLTDLQFEPELVGDPAKGQRTPAQLRTLIGKETTHEQCLRDDPDRMSLPPFHLPPGCDYSRIEVRKGRFAVASLCKDPETGETTTLAIEGAYAPEIMTARSVTTIFSGRTRIRMKQDLESRFTGSCDPIPVITRPPMNTPPIMVPPKKGN